MQIVDMIADDLLMIQNPARYTGGEFHYGTKDLAKVYFHTAICFPDLYEIGMSNNAVRILYDLLNSMEEVYCDRVFSVAPDFEQLLREKQLPLYTLDLQKPLSELDMLGISIGYELSATNILQVLDLGGIPLHACDRTDEHPIVICGGPAVTNPLPFAPFMDFVYIGEAEEGLQEVARILIDAKKQQKSRSEKLALLQSLPYLWYTGKKLALRFIDTNFATPESHTYRHYVVPNFKVAQDNGVVEIMRGCPNSCRFCHAGQYYKPYRQKQYSTMAAQVEQHVSDFGYREITLSSLSSGDHPYIKELIETLNAEYSHRHVSFSLPSLKVNSFSLGILEQLSEVRKSGLTFAIETPKEAWQRAMNKEVPLEQVIEIAREAKSRGWKLAKFYFMVGLPFVDRQVENQAIVDYVGAIYDATRLSMNINIGTFIPKAHTPFQWCSQLTPTQSYEQLSSLKKAINERIRGCKVSYHEPNISYLEGLISRGDERYAAVIESAYRKGCRLDAWDEYLKSDLWLEAIGEASYNPDTCIFEPYGLDEELPWDSVSMRVSKKFLKDEYEKAKNLLLTERCFESCSHLCGVCSKVTEVIDTTHKDPILEQVRDKTLVIEPKEEPISKTVQALITYRRFGRSLYISHIHAMRNFEMAFQRSKVGVQFTQGFNPKPKLEFVNPLSVGIAGDEEVMLAELIDSENLTEQEVKEKLGSALNDGYEIVQVLFLRLDKKQTLAKYLKGSLYTIETREDEKSRTLLESFCDQELKDVVVHKESEGLFSVRLEGEKNLVKSLFGNDTDKFALASRLRITRKALYAGSWGVSYPQFFASLQ
ncbi:MAG: TIGR03936 family radical SAM-associated protein [Sphaerochaeta sp.]|uniref:TIGR03936 family radical SAM-associated protein n=1 Tax=Sphaerochaeta sp. TaxID=1972642 RepID=UPI002A35F3B3|nr:TIGR03936 family radical SAM-associated protein [Sphaerochaeta sp.]MDX9823991.1 TIGR03936 family radical SAM-associated protein [Sphaerochaeta sp.]